MDGAILFFNFNAILVTPKQDCGYSFEYVLPKVLPLK